MNYWLFTFKKYYFLMSGRQFQFCFGLTVHWDQTGCQTLKDWYEYYNNIINKRQYRYCDTLQTICKKSLRAFLESVHFRDCTYRTQDSISYQSLFHEEVLGILRRKSLGFSLKTLQLLLRSLYPQRVLCTSNI